MSLWMFFIVTYFSCSSFAAPLKTMVSLPLSGSDIEQAQRRLNSERQLENFIFFIKGLDVYPDHTNPKEISAMENRNQAKKYYIAPFFQASEERSVVGGQEIADEGLKIMTEIYELLKAFDFELNKIQELTLEGRRKIGVIEKLRKNLQSLTDEMAIESTENLIAQLERDIADLKSEIKSLKAVADKGISETSPGLMRQVTNQVILKLSFLGIAANEEQNKKLTSEKPSDMRIAISSLIENAASQGQFGFRNAIYESGYTKQQRKWIALYRLIRPDIQIAPLATKAVFARATSLTAESDRNEQSEYFLRKSKIVRAPRIFLAVNGASGGACGNTKSCNVVIEYTWLGANMAKAAKFGAIIMPIYFEADVSFMQPDFAGSITCNFENGFKVEGRADVKDGAVIYDGDVYNQITYTAFEDGSCNYSITKGDGNSAAYYAIEKLYENYMNLKTERAAKARAEKDQYRNFITRELDYHANNSQKKDYEMWSLETWDSALAGGWGTVATFVIETARDFYWHTRIEDSKTTERVNFTTTINESNIQKTERMAFDGFTVLCWKEDNGTKNLSSCPSDKTSEYQKQADTDLGKSQQVCNEGFDEICLEDIKKQDRTLQPNEDGVVMDPWA